MRGILWLGAAGLAVGCGKEEPLVETGGVDTELRETGEETGTETGGDTSSPVSGELAVSPAAIQVAPGAQFGFQAHQDSAAVEARFSSSNPGVVEISEAGAAVALAVGEATVTADWGDRQAQAKVLVSADGMLSIQVIDSTAGVPLEDMRVVVEGNTYFTDPAGRVSVDTQGEGTQDILVYSADAHLYASALFLDVSTQEMILPMRARGADDPGLAVLQGSVDLSGTLLSGPDEKGAGLITIGLGASSFQQGALFFPLEQLFAANRSLSVEGIPIEAPSNLFVRDYGESWQGTAHPGPVSAWAFGGPVPRSELAQGLSGVAEALQFLVPHFDAFTWTQVAGIEAEAGAVHTADLTPNLPFDDRIEVLLPVLPEGISTATDALLIALSGPGDAGPVLTGMGQGTGAMMMSRVSPEEIDGEQGQVLAIAQVGGFGTDGAQSLALVDVAEGVADLSHWQTLADVVSFDRQTQRVVIEADEQATVIRVQVRSASGDRRDIYMPAGEHDRIIPTDGPPIGWANTTWNLLSIETPSESYQGLLMGGGLSQQSLKELATTSARTVAEFRVSE